MIEELAIAGGGIKGLAILGALSMMNTDNVKKISATSVGAIIGACVALRIPINEIIDIVLHTDISYIVEDKYIHELNNNLAITKGNRLNYFIKSFINLKEDENITLLNFYKKYNVHFIVSVTNLSTESTDYIDHISDPDIPLITLLRMATAIPFLFPPIKYKGNFYCDGALRDNFPTSVLSKNAWGIVPKRDYIKNRPRDDELTISQLISKVVNIRYENSKNNTIHIKNIIEIDVGDISSTTFDTSNDMKLKLIHMGIKAVIEKKMFPIVNAIWKENQEK